MSRGKNEELQLLMDLLDYFWNKNKLTSEENVLYERIRVLLYDV